MSSDIAISVQNLSKCYRIYNRPQDRFNEMIVSRLQKTLGMKPRHYGREFWALKDLSFEVKKGETFGIIGINGSGKSTLLQLIAGILEPTSGDLKVNGRIAALLELGSGFNPEFSGKENVFLNAGILGLTQEDTESRYQKIIEFADIGDFIDQPVKTYSSGMMVRLAFAVQASVDASIVIIDEALAVGDIFFRQKCYARLEDLKNSGAAILLVSHAMPEIEQYCDRSILLDHGKNSFIGPSSEAAKHYYLLNQGVLDKSVSNLSLSPPSIPFWANDANAEVLKYPPSYLFTNLEKHIQVKDEAGLCLRVMLANEAGEPCNSFKQGDLAVMFYEFRVLKDLEVPICGIVIKNDRNIIVHGKNSWQFDNEVPKGLKSGMVIKCRHELKLNIGVGTYSVEIGMASIPKKIWGLRSTISHEEMSRFVTRHCHADNVAPFSVGLAVKNGISVLAHHGITDLSSNLLISAYSADIDSQAAPSEVSYGG